jgi:DNA invertase Pin-like site-specific DNA recombinase
MRAAIYARVSTFDQEPENQLQELRRYVDARGWSAIEFVDRGVSGAKDRRRTIRKFGRAFKRLGSRTEAARRAAGGSGSRRAAVQSAPA